MNENLNLVEILKDCPRGTKLYYTVYGEVEFDHVSISSKYPIVLRLKDGKSYESLTSEGKYDIEHDGECLLFPSKDQRDWSKFKPKKDGLVPPCKFKDGDIVATNSGLRVFILQSAKSDVKGYCYVGYDFEINEFFFSGERFDRLATEEERQKLFDAIKESGYKWNAETKTLEKLVRPKFDPKTLQPFDKILMRDHSTDEWDIGYFSYIKYDLSGFDLSDCEEEGEFLVYTAGGANYWYAVPYNEDTKYLVGKVDEAPEYYRYWED